MQEQRNRQAHRGGSGLRPRSRYATSGAAAQRTKGHPFRSRAHGLRANRRWLWCDRLGRAQNRSHCVDRPCWRRADACRALRRQLHRPDDDSGRRGESVCQRDRFRLNGAIRRSRFPLISSAIPPVSIATTLATAGEFCGIARNRSLRCNAATVGAADRSFLTIVIEPSVSSKRHASSLRPKNFVYRVAPGVAYRSQQASGLMSI